MTRLVVVIPLQPLVTGARFSFRDWPLHVTVVQVFEASITQSIERMSRFEYPAFTVTAGDDEGFGPSGGIPVTVLEPSPQLSALHVSLTDALQPLELENPEFAGENYRAHVTIKQHGRVRSGDRIHLSQLALVDLTPGRQREVLAITMLTEVV